MSNFDLVIQTTISIDHLGVWPKQGRGAQVSEFRSGLLNSEYCFIQLSRFPSLELGDPAPR